MSQSLKEALERVGSYCISRSGARGLDADVIIGICNMSGMHELRLSDLNLMIDALSAQQGAQEQEPAAHMYPSDLERFQSGEHTATAFSIAVGCQDEESVPVYLHPATKTEQITYCAPAQNWDKYVLDAYACLRTHNSTIPSEVLDQMREILLAHPVAKAPEQPLITINSTQRNVLLAAAESLDNLGAPLNAADIRMIIGDEGLPEHPATLSDEQILAALREISSLAKAYDKDDYGLPLYKTSNVCNRMIAVIRKLIAGSK